MIVVWELIARAANWLLSLPWAETIVSIVSMSYIIAVNVFFVGAVCLMLGVSWRIVRR